MLGNWHTNRLREIANYVEDLGSPDTATEIRDLADSIDDDIEHIITTERMAD